VDVDVTNDAILHSHERIEKGTQTVWSLVVQQIGIFSCIFWRETMVFLPYLALAASLAAASVPVDLRRELTLLNDSPSQIEVQWINSATGERVTLSTPTVFQGLEFPLHSFVG